MDKLPLYFLSAFGHCGLDYLHSLLDGHPQILIMPAFSFYRSLKIIGCDKAKNADEMFALWRSYIEEHPGLQVERRKLFYDRGQAEKFYPEFKRLLASGGISRVNVFYSLHKAYVFALGIDLSNIRVLVAHEHNPLSLSLAVADFPGAGVIQVIRDPRATMAGSLRSMTDDSGYLSDYYFNFCFEDWMQAHQDWKAYNQKPGFKSKVVRNEDLHASLEGQMRGIANWLNIDFSPNLLKCTFSGRTWKGESAYMTKDNEYPQPEEIFYLPENVKKRWMKELSPGEIAMTEFITNESMKQFGYSRMTKDNIFSRIYGFFVFILPHRGLFKRWLKAYPDLAEFAKVSRRLKDSPKGKIWKYLPAPIKFVCIAMHSILVRLKIYFFPGDRSQRYI